MTKTRKTKKMRIDQIVAWVALTTIVISLITMIAMAVYSFAIVAESRYYTIKIAQAQEESKGFHPSTKQEYEDSVYIEEDAKRQELYESNAYTKWYFNTLNSFQRLTVIIAWLIVPAAVIYLVIWNEIKQVRKHPVHQTH